MSAKGRREENALGVLMRPVHQSPASDCDQSPPRETRVCWPQDTRTGPELYMFPGKVEGWHTLWQPRAL